MEGVNGLAYNVTSHLLYFSGGAGGAAGCGPTGGNNLVWYHVDPATGNLTSAAGHLPIAPRTDWAVASDGYRNSLVSDGPLYAGGFFTSNDSFLFSPPDTFAPTNASPWIRNNHDGEEAWETWYADGAFFNTTYFMPATAAACPGNYDSDTFGSACSVNGTSYAQGTVWYRWKIGQPEWPYPANSAIAQTAAPSAVAENATALSDTSVKFSWSTPADYAQPIVNWTFEYTLAGEPTSYLSLWGQNRSVTLTGLPRSVRVTYCVQATNLHWTGPCTPRSILTEERFSVQFSETGLPVGEGWWVNLSDGETLDSTNASFTVTEPNGTYGYTLATGDKVYAPTVTSGSFLVWGAGADERVIFDPVTYAITFTERGLPSNFEWWVTISGSTREGPNLRQFSNSTSLSFDVSNGSYSFIIGVTAGYTTNLTLGGVKLNGGPAQLTIVFRSPPGADTLFGLPRTEAYSILGAVAAGVILIGVAVLGLRRRRKPPAHAVVSPSSLGETPPHGPP